MKNVHAWTLTIQAAADVLRFIGQIGIYGKEEAVKRVRVQAERKSKSVQGPGRRWRNLHALHGTHWEKVKSIESVGIARTVAVNVPATHTYLTPGFFEHNTWTAGGVVPWFMQRFPDAIVPTTAPTWIQVRDLLWKEIAMAVAQAKVAYPKVNNTDWRWTKDHYAVGISTNEAERFQGYHAPHVLVVLDEAPGVREEIWEAIEGIEAGGDVRILALGNPTITSGRFYQAFTSNKAGWQTFTIDAFDTPNLADVPGSSAEEKMERLLWIEEHDPAALFSNPRPYLVTKDWVVRRYHSWGTNSPLWQARVRGRFPTHSADSLIALSWAESLWTNTPYPGAHVLGVDVARFGTDSTAYADLRGNRLDRLWKVQGRDTNQTTQSILRMVRSDPTLVVAIDDTGVGGGVVDNLRAENVTVIAFNAGESPIHNQDVANRGSEAYWSLAEALRDGKVALGDFDSSPGLDKESVDLLIEQLVGIDYKFTNRSKIQVMKKGKEEKGPSPDLADAVNMAWEAHRMETMNPAGSSIQVPPTRANADATTGLSSRDAQRFWNGWGGGLSQAAVDAGHGRPGSPVPGTPTGQGPDVDLASLRLICPQCGSLATMRELGRVEHQRNYEVQCTCGFRQIRKVEVK